MIFTFKGRRNARNISRYDTISRFKSKNYNHNVELDDLGESRIANIEFILRGKVKVYSKEKVEMIRMHIHQPLI